MTPLQLCTLTWVLIGIGECPRALLIRGVVVVVVDYTKTHLDLAPSSSALLYSHHLMNSAI